VHPDAPRGAAPAASSASADDPIAAHPLCIAHLGWSAGELGRTVLYRSRRRGSRVDVGYFVYWSSERPWGDNALTYALLPALITDTLYSHFLFVLPGLQRALYGAGDVEGVRVAYEENGDGTWTPISAAADDGCHHEVQLAPCDFVDERGRLVFMTRVWSHQLGGEGAVAAVREGRARLACYERQAMRPLAVDAAHDFRLGSADDPRRAGPAWGF
jgi:hypothetical protein